jgi:hypothetical protein
MDKITLHAAYAWDCEQCGVENFCRAITVDLAEIERSHLGVPPEIADTIRDIASEIERQFSDDFGEISVGGNFTTCPRTVTCASCGAEYEAVEDDDESGEFDPIE